MSHLWSLGEEEGWISTELSEDGYVLHSDEVPPIVPAVGGWQDRPTLWRIGGSQGGDRWAVVAGDRTDVRINGAPLAAGIKVLQHRDCLEVSRTRLFFAGDRRAVVERFPGGEREVVCQRCKKPIDAGQKAVRCPACSAWHHEVPDLKRQCWQYSEVCSNCQHPTSLTADTRWHPATL